MDPPTVVGIAVSLVNTGVGLITVVSELISDSIFYVRTHGPLGILLMSITSRSIWQLQAEVINLDDEKFASSSKKLGKEESTIVVVAVSFILKRQ